MTIWNLGSINADFVYRVPRIPAPGETLASTGRQTFLGGKGANMSVAAARAAARVVHVGAVGEDGRWAVERLLEYGVDIRHVAILQDQATAQAIIAVDDAGENSIILYPAANRAIPEDRIGAALAEAATGDWLLMQNETNGQEAAARMARDMGLRVAYAAAPFDAKATARLLPLIDLLVLNEVEAAQLREATGKGPADLGVTDVLVTLGPDGVEWIGAEGTRRFPAVPVEAVDTTGAGDTFTGYVLAGLDRGMPMAQAVGQATLAAAIMVTRHGTADVIPDLADLQSFRGADGQAGVS